MHLSSRGGDCTGNKEQKGSRESLKHSSDEKKMHKLHIFFRSCDMWRSVFWLRIWIYIHGISCCCTQWNSTLLHSVKVLNFRVKNIGLNFVHSKDDFFSPYVQCMQYVIVMLAVEKSGKNLLFISRTILS